MTSIRKILVHSGAAALTATSMFLPGAASAQLLSDTLTVSFDGVPQTRTLDEGIGESVTSDLSFTFQAAASGDFRPGNNADVFLIQPPGTNGRGIQSDKISFKVDDSGGRTVHFTLGSDQDPGRHNIVSGIVETGLLQNITQDLFPDGTQIGTTGFYSVKGHNIQVLAQSGVDAIPEPETYAMLLAGLGFMGFVARRRKQKNAAT